MNIIFFSSPAEFRQWLADNHASSQELWVGYYKKGVGKPTLTWPESVDQALCFGWIDGIRKTINEESYKIRFTPRKSTSTWSSVNIKRMQELIEAGLVSPFGLAAFERRKEDRSRIYAYEQENLRLPDQYEEQFKTHAQGWQFFQTQADWYRKTAIWWIISAKKTETQLKRLTQLILDSNNARPIPSLTRIKKLKPDK